MNVNFTIPFEDAVDMMNESPLFRRSVLYHLSERQSERDVINDKFLVDTLKNYVDTGFVESTKIPAIKFVRQWASTNKDRILTSTYETLYSLRGAKEFVEEVFRKSTE